MNGSPPTAPGDPWLDGNFVMGVSYFSAIAGIAADPVGVGEDLAWLKNRGFNHLRVRATWNRDWSDGEMGGLPPVQNACLFRASDGTLITDRLDSLKDFLDAATDNGFTVDVTSWYKDYEATGCNGQTCTGTEGQCWSNYVNGVASLVFELKGQYPNVFIDVANEGFANPQVVGIEENWVRIQELKEAAVAADPDRFLTFSQVAVDEFIDPGDLGYNIVPGGEDLAAPLFRRTDDWDEVTVVRMDYLRSILDTVMPIHLQEEARVGWCDGGGGGSSAECQDEHILNSLSLSVYAGAAGWNFHTSAGYDLAASPFLQKLGPLGGTNDDECNVVLCAGVVGQAALDQQAQAGCVLGQLGIARIRDTFSQAAEDVLNGTDTEVGERTWSVSPASGILRVQSEQNVRRNFPGQSPVGGVAYEPPTDGATTVLSVDINPSDSDSNDPTVAVGFSADAVGAFEDVGRFWMELNDAGAYWVWDFGQNNPELAIGTAPTFFPDAPNRVELEYDRTANTGVVRINEVEILPLQVLTQIDPAQMQAVATEFGASAEVTSRIDNIAVCEVPTQLKDIFLTTGDLDGQTTTVGGETWSTAAPSGCAAPFLQVVNGEVVTNCTALPAAGLVPFDASATGEIASVIVDVTYGESMNFGFSRTSVPDFRTEEPYLDRLGELWVEIGGQITVYEGSTALLAINYPQHPTGSSRFRLSYDPISQTAGLWENGSPWAPRMPLSQALDIQGAGIEITHPDGFFGSMEVDTFEVRRESALARDGFESTQASLLSGLDDLNGLAMPFGARTWEASNAQVANGVVVRTGPGSALATVPLPEVMLNNVIEVSATIGEGAASWTAIGFADRPATGFVLSGQVWMFLTPSQWKVKVGPTGSAIATGSLLGASPRRARLRYDPLARTVTAFVDDIKVVDAFEIDDLVPISITDVGLQIRENDGYVDDFEVRLTCQQ
jgi:hypothetical protein